MEKSQRNVKQYSRLVLFTFTAAILLLQGCSTYSAKTSGIRDSIKSGRPDLALREFETQSHDNSDLVLTHLHKGMLKRMTGDYVGSNKEFEVAKKEMADLYTTSISKSIGSVVTNDTVRDYAGDRYEQVLLHAYMALNYIALGKLDDARVEVLQADIKMKEWGETPLEDPFVRYLSGIIFEALGEYDQAIVSYRKAVDVYKATIKNHGLQVPDQLKKDLMRVLYIERRDNELKHYESVFNMRYDAKEDQGKGHIIAILDNGLGPARSQHTIMTWAPAINQRLKIALPTYKRRKNKTHRARVVVDGQTYALDTVENIDGMARKSLAEEMPSITLRAVARMVVKHQAAKEAEKRGGQYGGLLGLAFKIGGMVSEVADTRSWSSLPQEIQLVRVPVNPGSYTAKIEILGRGSVVDALQHQVIVKKNRLTFVSDHWVAPRPAITKQTQAAK